MEWAERITVENHKLVASIVGADHERRSVPVTKLSKSGLPVEHDRVKFSTRRRLSELERCTHDEYMAFTGLDPEKVSPNHAVFRFQTWRRTWLVPALVLMRAFFKPNQHLLGEMFLPHALQRVAIPDVENPGRLVLVAPWCTSPGQKSVDESSTLHWFWNESAAGRMAHSVHDHAMSGRIDIDLAPLDVELSIRGIRKGTTVFVTSVQLLRAHVEATGKAGSTKVMSFDNRLSAQGNRAGAMQLLKIAAGRGGSLSVTDQEWSLIQHHLAKVGSGPKFKQDKREVLNRVLVWAAGEVTVLKQLETVAITATNLSKTHSRWRDSGVLQRIVSELNHMRTCGDAAVKAVA